MCLIPDGEFKSSNSPEAYVYFWLQVTGSGYQVMNPHPQAVDKVSPQQSMFPSGVDSVRLYLPSNSGVVA